ncbi:mucin-5AC-like [Physella acuta]|uniref:mucin-5AC-like n=1 Tax=Physella acuta TaxID=109671 RepID=UPI0027DCE9B6|nr:mucin-5AC-like [Physella acuta]
MRDCLAEYAGNNCKPGDEDRVYNAVKSILSTLHAFICKPEETTINTTSSPTVTTDRTTTTSYVTTQETTGKPNDTLTTRIVHDATTTYPRTTTTSASTNAAGTTATTQTSATTVDTTSPNQATTSQAPPNVEYECYKCNSGCNMNKPNRKCPANGKMRFNTPTIKCTGPCVSFVNTTS